MITDRTYANYKAILPIPAWEEAIKKWASGGNVIPKSQEGPPPEVQSSNNTGFAIGRPPTEICTQFTADTQANRPSLKIISHNNGDTIPAGFTDVEVEVSAPNGLKEVQFFSNDNLQYSDTSAPFVGTMRIARNTEPGTKFLFKTQVVDTLGYAATEVISVEIE